MNKYMYCFSKPKCNWCNDNKVELYKITKVCKWQGLHICNNCLINKLNNKGDQRPKYK